MKRDIPWPGKQLNDINEFRHDCYYQCHLQNPTDSGWYEKVDECGQNCKKALQAYEYQQGKNPCELKLQAPVFWFENHSGSKGQDVREGYENYDGVKETPEPSHCQSVDTIYLILMTIMILLMLTYLILYMISPR